MSAGLAFIGDVHGDLDKLRCVLDRLSSTDRTVVFLGDYVNYGCDSAGVLDALVKVKSELGERVVLLAGNHDVAFLRFLDGADLATLLAMGGAPTVSSYIGSPEADVAEQLRSAVPASHRAVLRQLRSSWWTDEVLAMHMWPEARLETAGRFIVLGHYHQQGGVPLIEPTGAYIDTGCGRDPEGKLTCLLWPELEWFSS